MLPEADLGHSFSLYGPTLIFFFQALKRKKTHLSVTVTVVRDRKLRTALRTNQIVGFVTVPAWKKLKSNTVIWPNESHTLVWFKIRNPVITIELVIKVFV